MIYVIVENKTIMEPGEFGPLETVEALVINLGYFTDEIQAEAKVDELNAKHLAESDDDEEDNERFGFVCVDPAKHDPDALRKIKAKLLGGKPS